MLLKNLIAITSLLLAQFAFSSSVKNPSNSINASENQYFPISYFAVSKLNLLDVSILSFDEFLLANKKSFHLSACLVESKEFFILPPDSHFTVITTSNDTLALRTNLQGCINWTEIIPYNPLARETDLEMSRTIESTNGYVSGTLTLKFKLNPFSNKLIYLTSTFSK